MQLVVDGDRPISVYVAVFKLLRQWIKVLLLLHHVEEIIKMVIHIGFSIVRLSSLYDSSPASSCRLSLRSNCKLFYSQIVARFASTCRPLLTSVTLYHESVLGPADHRSEDPWDCRCPRRICLIIRSWRSTVWITAITRTRMDTSVVSWYQFGLFPQHDSEGNAVIVIDKQRLQFPVILQEGSIFAGRLK